jgi:hypothetical protein
MCEPPSPDVEASPGGSDTFFPLKRSAATCAAAVISGVVEVEAAEVDATSSRGMSSPPSDDIGVIFTMTDTKGGGKETPCSVVVGVVWSGVIHGELQTLIQR